MEPVSALTPVPSPQELYRRCNARAEGVRPFLASCAMKLQGAVSLQSAGSPQALGLQRIVRQALWQAQRFKEQVHQDSHLFDKLYAGGSQPEVVQLQTCLQDEVAEALALCALFSSIKESLSNSHASQSPKEIDVSSKMGNLAVLAQAPEQGFEDVSITAEGCATRDFSDEVAKTICLDFSVEKNQELKECNAPGPELGLCDANVDLQQHQGHSDVHTAGETALASPISDIQPARGSLPPQGEELDAKIEQDVDPVADARLTLPHLAGKASAKIARALPCKDLFALRMASKATLEDTNQQIEQRLKQLWFEAVRGSPTRKSAKQSRERSRSRGGEPDMDGSPGGQKRSESSESLASDQSGQSEEPDQNQSPPGAESGQQSSQSPAPECPKSDERGVSHQKSAPHDVPIFLNIYDVTHYAGVQWLNALFANQYSPVKFGGIFHIGVQIGQKEWSYGYKADGTGVFWTPPLFQAAHHFRESVRMPPTKLSKRRIASVITELEAEWTGCSYNVFGRNCCHFADALCQRLDVGRVPEWTCRLANIGSTAAEAFRLLDGPTLMPLSLCSKAPAVPALPAPEVLPELPGAPSGVDI